MPGKVLTEKCHTVLKDIRDDAGPLSWKGLCTTAWYIHFLTSYNFQTSYIFLLVCKGAAFVAFMHLHHPFTARASWLQEQNVVFLSQNTLF